LLYSDNSKPLQFNINDIYKTKNKIFIDKIINEITKKKNGNWTKDEFLKLIRRPEVDTIYYDILNKYARFDSKQYQEKEAENYLKIFMREDRIEKGVKFLIDYQKVLVKAEKDFNVAGKDIVSILMWESGLGEFTGNYRVFNVFLNQILYLDLVEELLVLDYEKKNGKTPYKNLEEENKAKRRIAKIRESAVNSIIALLRESKKKNIDPLEQLGSWGGAIGYVQFMPFNLHYAIDGDNNGTIDLYTFPDAIFSCANFLKTVGKYKNEENNRKKAIYRYNPSNNYVIGVITYADTIWNRYLKRGNK
jgi:membrane-bound lytic murein transglycosylase B